MKKITITLGLIIGMIHLLQAQSNKVFLPYLEAINIKKDFQISATKLLKNYIDLANKYQVVMDGNKDTLFDAEKSTEEIKNKAKQLDAAYFIKGSLNRIGDNVLVNVSMFETATGNKVWFDQLKATSPEDLDPIMQRVGNSIGTQTKATAVDDIYSVTNQETAVLNQKQTNNSFGIGLGGIAAFNSYQLLLTTASLGWYFDARNFIFDIRPTLGFDNSNNHMFNLALEMFKPHTTNSNSVYYGGGVSYSTSSIHTDKSTMYALSGSGINISAGGGYLFNRTSAVSMRIGGNLFYGIHDITAKDFSNSVTLRDASPFGIELKVEILFKR